MKGSITQEIVRFIKVSYIQIAKYWRSREDKFAPRKVHALESAFSAGEESLGYVSRLTLHAFNVNV